MKVLGVREVADRLAVSPRRVRQMLEAGDLSGQRISGSWIVSARAVAVFEHSRRPAGRPWSASSAWAVLDVAGGGGQELESLQRSRARARLRSVGLDGLVDRLASRASPRSFFGHPGMLDDLISDPDLVRSGVSALSEYPVGLVVGDEVEGYVRSSRIAALVSRFALDELSEHPNVVLRDVGDEFWPFDEDQVVAPKPVVAVDLLDAADSRSRRAGAALAASL